MNNVYQYRTEAGLKDDMQILLQVHDELLFEIKKQKMDTVVPELILQMESVLSDVDTQGVPITVAVEYGPNWGELASWKEKD